jgi:hypothetical protein
LRDGLVFLSFYVKNEVEKSFGQNKGEFMFKRYLSTILTGLLVLSIGPTLVFAQSGADAAKVKAEVTKRGVNEKKPVRVKMLDGSKIKGYISQVGDESFTLTPSKTKQPKVIAYQDVKRVEGRGLSGGARVGIIVGAAIAGTLLIIYIAFENAVRNN